MSIRVNTDKVYEDVQLVLDAMDIVEIDENSSIIFDIDNTLIDAQNNIIEPVMKIYKTAVEKKFNIFIVSSRFGDELNIELTKRQLKNKGITEYNSMYLLKPDRFNVIKMKYNARKNIKDRGFNTFFSFGDKLYDGFNCKYAGRFFQIEI